jgi:hypothetical protein
MEPFVAVREFTDSKGVAWRAWDVTPESIHPITKAEDYLADCYREGWIVFETVDGGDKRRLCPPPVGWSDFSAAELEELVAKSERVETRQTARPPHRRSDPVFTAQDEQVIRQMHVEPRAVRRDLVGLPALDSLGVARAFEYPSGRRWVVCVYEHIMGDGYARPVLRFTTGARTADLDVFPEHWADLEEERLIELLRTAAPRPAGQISEASHRRRHGEQESSR